MVVDYEESKNVILVMLSNSSKCKRLQDRAYIVRCWKQCSRAGGGVCCHGRGEGGRAGIED